MIIPAKLEISYMRYPVSNIVIIIFTVILEFLFLTNTLSFDHFEAMVLRDWNIEGLIGNMFIHAGLYHLIGNMIFLWVFGNAINATVGNIAYPFLYVFLGLCAASTHLLFHGGPAVGASGAINGVIGMALVLYPKNKLKFYYAFFWLFAGIFKVGKFEIKAFWMILLWFIFDILGVLIGGGNVAYFAHIGGFAAGIVIAFILTSLNLVETYSPTYKDVITGAGKETETEDQALFDENIPGSVTKGTAHLQTNLQYEEMKLEEESRQMMAANREATPEFKILKTIPSPQSITCYYVNKGDRISNINLQPLSNFEIQITPPDIIEKGGSGAIKFSNITDPAMGELKFEIGFSNPDGTHKVMELAYSKTSNSITTNESAVSTVF